jgi:hypothetical protein
LDRNTLRRENLTRLPRSVAASRQAHKQSNLHAGSLLPIRDIGQMVVRGGNQRLYRAGTSVAHEERKLRILQLSTV